MSNNLLSSPFLASTWHHDWFDEINLNKTLSKFPGIDDQNLAKIGKLGTQMLANGGNEMKNCSVHSPRSDGGT